MAIKKFSRNKKHGIVQMAISILWILNEFNYLYIYHVKGGIYIYQTPDLIIYLNIVFAFIAITVGYKTIKEKLRVRIGYLTILIGWITAFSIEILV